MRALKRHRRRPSHQHPAQHPPRVAPSRPAFCTMRRTASCCRSCASCASAAATASAWRRSSTAVRRPAGRGRGIAYDEQFTLPACFLGCAGRGHSCTHAWSGVNNNSKKTHARPRPPRNPRPPAAGATRAPGAPPAPTGRCMGNVVVSSIKIGVSKRCRQSAGTLAAEDGSSRAGQGGSRLCTHLAAGVGALLAGRRQVGALDGKAGGQARVGGGQEIHHDDCGAGKK